MQKLMTAKIIKGIRPSKKSMHNMIMQCDHKSIATLIKRFSTQNIGTTIIFAIFNDKTLLKERQYSLHYLRI